MHLPPPGGLARGLHEGQVRFEYDTFCPWERPIGLEQVRRHPVLAPLAVLTPAIREADLPGVRRAILDLVAARLERAPEGLAEGLSGLDADELHGLFSQLLRAADEGQLRALLPGK
jgi:hypothetical protein